MNSSEIKFQRIFEQGQYSDLLQLSDGRILTGDGSSFDIHKVILAKYSDFFRSMFCGMDKGKREYRIPNITGECMSDILCYIYTKYICVSERNIVDLLLASDYFLQNDLYSKVIQCSKTMITDSNCLKLYQSLYQLNENDMSHHCFTFILAKFERILKDQKIALADLPVELLKRILSNRNLNVQSERTVWEAIKVWTISSTQSRLKDVPTLLSTLATDEVGENLASEIMNHDIVVNNSHMSSIKSSSVFNSYRDILVNVLLNFSKDCPMKKSRIPRKINVISRYTAEYEESETGEIFISYDETPDLWRKIADIDLEPEYLITIGSNIYIFPKTGEACLNFNLVSLEWEPLRNGPYCSHTLLVIENHIYIIGLNSDGMYNIEVYNNLENTWLLIASLDNTYNAAAVAMGKNLLVVGTDLNMEAMIAQMLNPLTRQWSSLPSPNIYRYHFELVEYHSKIYLIGGLNSFNESASNVEVYDPSENRWKELPDIPFVYAWVAVIVVNDQMIVYDFVPMLSINEPESTAVRYNEKEECWENLGNFCLPRNLHKYRLSTVNDVETLKILTKKNRSAGVQMEKSPFNFS